MDIVVTPGSSTQLSIAVQPADVTSPGNVAIVVTNPTPCTSNQCASNSKSLNVSAEFGTVHYVYSDQLNTPRAITDASNNLVWTWDNTEPFGNNAPNQNPSGSGTQFVFNPRFPGQYFDGETGLNYNYFRDYDPATGRYLESDPIGMYGGVNTYGYVGGKPLSNVDPNGLLKFSVTFGGNALFGQWGWLKESGIGFDTSGHICFVVNNCTPDSVIGGFVSLGGTVSGEKGNFCPGTSKTKTHNLLVDLGLGKDGGISIPTNEDYTVPEGGGKAFGGVGVGAGAAKLVCETKTICTSGF